MKAGYHVDEEACVGCRCCKTVCPSNAVRVSGTCCSIDERLCVACGACAARCPYGAVKELG